MVEVGWEPSTENVIIWKFATPWTFDEFRSAKNKVDAMIDQVEGCVDSIFLISAGQVAPKNALTQLRKMISEAHERHRYIVLVGVRVYLATLLKILGELIPNFEPHLRVASTRAGAIQMIKNLRQTAP